MATPQGVFRPFRSSEAERSDRSAGDRQRHRQKIRESIRENIADIVAEESIIGRDRDRLIKVPIRGIKEYRFIYGPNAPGVGQGNGEEERGQVVGESQQGQGKPGEAGDRPGVDYYETDIRLDELIDIMFEDLELPDLERKKLRHLEAEKVAKRKGYRRAGVRVRLDKRETIKAKLKRQLAGRRRDSDGESIPFHDDDLTYRHMTTKKKRESNAAVICMMDTSGSMDTTKKYLARSFFFLLYQFILSKYHNVELAFIAHHTTAREVTEEEFFHKGDSGGTLISSAYTKALEVITDRYHPSLWNVYAFHCSDGDNFDSDNAAAIAAAQQLTDCCNLFGYGEIKPHGSSYYESSMLNLFKRIAAPNFQRLLIEKKDDIWPSFRSFLDHDHTTSEN